MARQIERANNIARILEITASFSRQDGMEQPWQAVLDLYSDQEPYLKHHDTVTPEQVLHYYILDERNPNSIRSNVTYARENARALRPLLATELWTQLNVFHAKMTDITRRDLRDEKIADVCAFVKTACQTHVGLVSETLFRDEEWYFYSIGQNLERADQTTRLVDVKYHMLLPNDANVGSQVDLGQWNAVLRSAAGLQAYRRVHNRELTSEKVAGFLLLDKRFPRSVANSTELAFGYLQTLIERYELSDGRDALLQAKDLAEQTRSAVIKTVIGDGMHQWIDDVQEDISKITSTLSAAFFKYSSEA